MACIGPGERNHAIPPDAAPPEAIGTAARRDGADWVLAIHVQPGAKTTAFAGMHGDRIKIRISAQATDGRANACLIEFLAEVFGVPKTRVVLEQGAGGRQKLVRVVGVGRIAGGLPAEIPAEIRNALRA